MRHLTVGLAAILLVLAACGDDDDEFDFVTQQPLILNNTQAATVLSVAGDYEVELTPFATNCIVEPSFSFNLFTISQFGATIFIDIQPLAVSSTNSIVISGPALQGTLTASNDFAASTEGDYFDDFTGNNGPFVQLMNGSFTLNIMQGIVDTTLFDLFFGISCTLSHRMFGVRQ